jgi:ABC-type transport system involved in multi-copper enzyme maturation permease subunit
MEHPLGSGKLAIGVMASLPGAILILLLAAGHVGNEWNGRTITAVLTQEGHRSRLLAAKAVTLWVAALGIVLVDWAALAGFSLVLKAAYHLPGGSIPWPAAWSAVAHDAARAPLVLAVFVIIGVAAAVLVRNTLGGFLLAGGAVIASMVAAGFSGISRLTLAYWVSGWMQFQPRAYVVYHFWSDRYPSGVSPPGQLRGLLGLAAVIVVGATLAVTTLKRVDIST